MAAKRGNKTVMEARDDTVTILKHTAGDKAIRQGLEALRMMALPTPMTCAGLTETIAA